MGFRERPEYNAWRDAVAALFGEKCIACGHDGNIHMHHIQPVEDYPELAFDPKNGVPLCGNCHSKVRGREMEFADQFRQLQERCSGISRKPAPTIEELRQAAVADLSNEATVMALLQYGPDPKQAVDFYEQYQGSIKMTSRVAGVMSCRFYQVGRHLDAIRFADTALEMARSEGIAAQTVGELVIWKRLSLNALGRGAELRPYLEALLREFPDNADLHFELSLPHGEEPGRWTILSAYFTQMSQPHGEEHLAETDPRFYLTHALRAVELCPETSLQLCNYLNRASFLCATNGRLKEAMGFAKRAFTCARRDQQRMTAIIGEAEVFVQAKLYEDALTTYRKALGIDPQNADVLAYIARCLYMQNRVKAAVEMARRSLLYDPNNAIAKIALSHCEQRGQCG